MREKDKMAKDRAVFIRILNSFCRKHACSTFSIASWAIPRWTIQMPRWVFLYARRKCGGSITCLCPPLWSCL